jgi:hypothetical protein
LNRRPRLDLEKRESGEAKAGNDPHNCGLERRGVLDAGNGNPFYALLLVVGSPGVFEEGEYTAGAHLAFGNFYQHPPFLP